MVDGTSEVSLLTSIPPRARDLHRQEERFAHIRAAVASFSANGFACVSVNRQDEIDVLQPLFPDVRFVIAAPAEEIFPGRYGPSLKSIFGALDAPAPCAIVNADNYMLRSEILGCLNRNPDTTFVARRLDVTTDNPPHIAGVYERGIDGVFLSKLHFEPIAGDSALMKLKLGAPFWDIVIPIAASFHGKVRFIAPPFLLHPLHEANWSHADYDQLRLFSIRALADHARRHAQLMPRAALFDRLVSEFVYSQPKLGRRAVRNAMSIFDLWLKRIESADAVTISTDETLASVEILTAGGPPGRLAHYDTPPGKATPGAFRRWKARRHERRRQVIRSVIDASFDP